MDHQRSYLLKHWMVEKIQIIFTWPASDDAYSLDAGDVLPFSVDWSYLNSFCLLVGIAFLRGSLDFLRLLTETLDDVVVEVSLECSAVSDTLVFLVWSISSWSFVSTLALWATVSNTFVSLV